MWAGPSQHGTSLLPQALCPSFLQAFPSMARRCAPVIMPCISAMKSDHVQRRAQYDGTGKSLLFAQVLTWMLSHCRSSPATMHSSWSGCQTGLQSLGLDTSDWSSLMFTQLLGLRSPSSR